MPEAEPALFGGTLDRAASVDGVAYSPRPVSEQGEIGEGRGEILTRQQEREGREQNPRRGDAARPVRAKLQRLYNVQRENCSSATRIAGDCSHWTAPRLHSVYPMAYFQESRDGQYVEHRDESGTITARQLASFMVPHLRRVTGLRRDQMGHLWRSSKLKFENCFLKNSIGIGHSLMLPKVLNPGLN